MKFEIGEIVSMKVSGNPVMILQYFSEDSVSYPGVMLPGYTVRTIYDTEIFVREFELDKREEKNIKASQGSSFSG